MTRTPLLLLPALLMAGPVLAAVDLATPAATYTQTFDSLASSGTANAWTNDLTLPGWSLFASTGAAIPSYGTDTSNGGAFRSFGSTGSNERALGGTASGGAYFGSPASGAVAGWIALALTNTSAVGFDSFTLGFDGEQWRNGGNTSAQTLALQYGFGASFAAVAIWTAAGSSFNFSSPVFSASAAAVDGNGAGRVAGLGGTVATAWAPGSTLWLRWVENNDVGNDHGLGIDNLSLSVTSAVPEPAAQALLLAGLLGLALARRRRA